MTEAEAPDAGAPTAEPAPAARERIPGWLWVTFAAATAGLLAAVWVVDYLPTHDGPHHVFEGHLENHFDDPGTPYATYMVRGHPLTAVGFQLVFALLDRFLPWRTALRATLSLLVLTWAWGHVALCASLHRRRAVIGLLGFASGVPWVLYMGFFSFVWAVGLGLLVLAAAIAGWPWTPLRRVAIAGALTIVAVAHAFGAELLGVALIALVLVRAERAREREILLLGAMGLPAMAIAATPRSIGLVDTRWLPFGDLATALPRMFLPGPLWRAWVPVLLGLAGVAAAFARRRRSAVPAADRALSGVCAACFVAAVALPLDYRQWEFMSPRVLPFAVLAGAALLPVEALARRWRNVLAAALAMFTAASLAVGVQTSLALRARADDALSGLSQPIRRSGPRLCAAVPAEAVAGAGDPIPFQYPLKNIAQLYAVEQGGMCPYQLAGSPSLHPFVFTEDGKARFPKSLDPAYFFDPVLLDPRARKPLLTLLARTAGPFEDAVYVGRPEDGDTLIERGFVPSFRHGGLFIGHFEGCPVRIDVDVRGAGAGAVVAVEYGFDPGVPAAFQAELVAEKEGEPLRITPRLDVCGHAFVRAGFVDTTSKGRRLRGACIGADRTGKLPVMARPGAVFGCTIDVANGQ